MTAEQRQWQQCLAMIRERVKNDHVYDVWFRDLLLDSYNQEAKTVVLQVSSHYICEFIEMMGVRMMSEVLAAVFGSGTRLRYRLKKPEPTFADVAEYLQQHSAYNTRHDPYNIQIPNAHKRMEDGLRYFLKGEERWLPAYDKVADWLTDNKGRGLLCVGTTGLGKSLLCQNILPVILGNGGRSVASVSATDLYSHIEDLKKEPIVIIDDLGKEPRRKYGNIDQSFFELCNNAERTGHLLIITTNLSTTPYDRTLYPSSIQETYGIEVLDRLKSITAFVRFDGPSLRK